MVCLGTETFLELRGRKVLHMLLPHEVEVLRYPDSEAFKCLLKHLTPPPLHSPHTHFIL